MLEYPVKLLKDTNGHITVTFPDVPEAVTEGADRAEALAQAVDALETALSFYVDNWQPLPSPSAARGKPLVRPSLIGCMKLGLYQAMRTRKMRKADLARRLRAHPPQVDRLLDLTHSSRIEQIEAAYQALEAKVSFELELA